MSEIKFNYLLLLTVHDIKIVTTTSVLFGMRNTMIKDQ